MEVIVNSGLFLLIAEGELDSLEEGERKDKEESRTDELRDKFDNLESSLD